MKRHIGSHENNFDLLRLFAAVQVLLLHHIAFFSANSESTYGLIDRIIWNFPGVNIFFIISGYLIFQSLERNNILIFAKKRIKRIYPALFACFIFTVLMLILFNSLNTLEIFSFDFAKWVLAQLTVFQFYNPDIIRDFGFGPPNGALWTISVEIQFYIFIMILWHWVLVKKSIKTQNIVLALVFVVSGAYNYLFNTYLSPNGFAYKLSFVLVLPYLYFFATGGFIYINREFFIPKLKGKAFLWIVFFIVTCLLSDHFQIRYHRYVFNGLSFFMLVLLTGLIFSIAYTNMCLSKRILKGNDISYGIYIYQMPVINLFYQLKYNTNIPQFLLSVSVCIILGALSWFLIEKKILKR